MQLCDDGHEEIVFEVLGSLCPLCELLGQHQDELDDIKSDGETKITELQERVSILEVELEEERTLT